MYQPLFIKVGGMCMFTISLFLAFIWPIDSALAAGQDNGDDTS